MKHRKGNGFPYALFVKRNGKWHRHDQFVSFPSHAACAHFYDEECRKFRGEGIVALPKRFKPNAPDVPLSMFEHYRASHAHPKGVDDHLGAVCED